MMNLEKIYMRVAIAIMGGAGLFWLVTYFFGDPYWISLAKATGSVGLCVVAAVPFTAILLGYFLQTFERIKKLIEKIRK
jgi:hypothetical protein